MATTYQVHLHVNAPHLAHGVAEFETMTEAYLYLIDLIAQLVFYVPDVYDAEWVDDDLVRIIAKDGRVLGTCTVILTTPEVIH